MSLIAHKGSNVGWGICCWFLQILNFFRRLFQWGLFPFLFCLSHWILSRKPYEQHFTIWVWWQMHYYDCPVECPQYPSSYYLSTYLHLPSVPVHCITSNGISGFRKVPFIRRGIILKQFPSQMAELFLLASPMLANLRISRIRSDAPRWCVRHIHWSGPVRTTCSTSG